jgi:2-polyprenyl-3-methyl-5-hydroxy-6-metoxy-1,4-benzoquinol methylase
VKCNLCSTDKTKLVFKINNYKIVRCKNCGLTYVNPRLKEDKLHEIYTENYYRNVSFNDAKSKKFFGYDLYIEEKDDIVKTFKRRLDVIEKHVKKGRILDVGCATGFFLELAKKRGWEVYGTDLSKFACNYAKKSGLKNIYCTELEKARFKDNMFDAVVIFDVIEHLPDPKKTLKEVRRILKHNGMVAITTPNIGSSVAKILGKRWEEVRRVREHIYFFSTRTLSKMLETLGFRAVKTESAGRYFSFNAAIRRGKIHFPKVFSWLGNIVNVLNIQDKKVFVNPRYKVTVYAKKNGQF